MDGCYCLITTEAAHRWHNKRWCYGEHSFSPEILISDEVLCSASALKRLLLKLLAGNRNILSMNHTFSYNLIDVSSADRVVRFAFLVFLKAPFYPKLSAASMMLSMTAWFLQCCGCLTYPIRVMINVLLFLRIYMYRYIQIGADDHQTHKSFVSILWGSIVKNWNGVEIRICIYFCCKLTQLRLLSHNKV